MVYGVPSTPVEEPDLVEQRRNNDARDQIDGEEMGIDNEKANEKVKNKDEDKDKVKDKDKDKEKEKEKEKEQETDAPTKRVRRVQFADEIWRKEKETSEEEEKDRGEEKKRGEGEGGVEEEIEEEEEEGEGGWTKKKPYRELAKSSREDVFGKENKEKKETKRDKPRADVKNHGVGGRIGERDVGTKKRKRSDSKEECEDDEVGKMNSVVEDGEEEDDEEEEGSFDIMEMLVRERNEIGGEDRDSDEDYAEGDEEDVESGEKRKRPSRSSPRKKGRRTLNLLQKQSTPSPATKKRKITPSSSSKKQSKAKRNRRAGESNELQEEVGHLKILEASSTEEGDQAKEGDGTRGLKSTRPSGKSADSMKMNPATPTKKTNQSPSLTKGKSKSSKTNRDIENQNRTTPSPSRKRSSSSSPYTSPVQSKSSSSSSSARTLRSIHPTSKRQSKSKNSRLFSGMSFLVTGFKVLYPFERLEKERSSEEERRKKRTNRRDEGGDVDMEDVNQESNDDDDDDDDANINHRDVEGEEEEGAEGNVSILMGGIEQSKSKRKRTSQHEYFENLGEIIILFLVLAFHLNEEKPSS